MRDARLITRIDRLAEDDVAVVLKPLEFIKIIDRYEHRCGLPVLRQHNTFMAAPGTVDQFGEVTAGLRNRTRERHSSTVQLDADGCRYGAPTAAARRRGPVQGTPLRPPHRTTRVPGRRRARRPGRAGGMNHLSFGRKERKKEGRGLGTRIPYFGFLFMFSESFFDYMTGCAGLEPGRRRPALNG